MSSIKPKTNDVIKHSASHVLATAVKRLYPDVKVGIGPVTKEGYYYDFYFGNTTPDIDLKIVEDVANEIVMQNLSFQQLILNRDDAYNMLLQLGQIFKAELIQAIPDPEVSFYKLGNEFLDLCRGPHVPTTNTIGFIKVLSKSKVYWKDDPKRAEMLRIFGTVFNSEQEYKEFEEIQDKIKDRDLFIISAKKHYINSIVNDRIIFTEKGTSILEEINNQIYENLNYLSPKVLNLGESLKILETSELINSNLLTRNVSYKALPLTYMSITTTTQNINAKLVNGPLIMYKSFVLKSQGMNETSDLVEKIITTLHYFTKENLNIDIYCSNLTDEFVETMSFFLEKKLISHNKVLSNKTKGNFKMDFVVNDSMGKNWHLSTLKLYSDTRIKFDTEKNTKENPLILEVYFKPLNILGYTLEENGDNLPFNLNPVQIICIPVSKEQSEFSSEVVKLLNSMNFRAELDSTSQSLKFKIRRAENKNIPYIFIIGNKEVTNKAVSVRQRGAEIGLISIPNIKSFIDENIRKA